MVVKNNILRTDTRPIPRTGCERRWCEIARALTEQTQTCLMFILRAERHPEDPGKKADEA